MSAPTLRPLGFGEILDGAFTLYRRNLVPFLLTALLPMAAVIAAFGFLGAGMYGAITGGEPGEVMGAMFGTGLLLVLLGIGAFSVMTAALTREASHAYMGQQATLGDGMRAGLRALLPLLGVAFVVGIIFLVAMFALGIVLTIVILMTGGGGVEAAGAVTGISMLLGMVGYLAGISLLFAVLPAVVVEGKGPLSAIGRSVDLARGALGRVAGVIVVTFLITYLPGLAVMALTGGFASLMNPETVPSTGQFMTQQVLGMGVYVLTTPFFVSVIVLLYFDRRVRTEALDVQMAADRLAVAGS